MNLEFQNIEENGIGKMFALLEGEDMPVGQLFYKIDNENKNIVIDYIYIPRKYWREGAIREQLIAKIQDSYPLYSFNMKENQRQAHLLKESPARSKAQFRYMQGICNGSIEPPEGMTRAQACEYVEGQKDYKKLPSKKEKISAYEKISNLEEELAKKHNLPIEVIKNILEEGNTLTKEDKKPARRGGPKIRETRGLEFTRDIIAEYVSGHGLEDIANRYGISTTAIRTLLKDNKIPTRPAGSKMNRHPDTRRKKDLEKPFEFRPNAPKNKKTTPKNRRGLQNTRNNWMKLKYKSPSIIDIDTVDEKIKREIEQRQALQESGEVPFIPYHEHDRSYSGDYIPYSEDISLNPRGRLRLRPDNSRMEYIAKWRVTKKYTHLNPQGKPCSCTFYRPELNWRKVEAAKIDLLTGDKMPKVLKTDEGQEVLRWIKTLPEKVDDLLPWLVREYKKRRLIPKLDDDGFVIGMIMPETEVDGDLEEYFDDGLLAHIADWFESKSPTRRGVDIMQLSAEELIGKIEEWNKELASQGLKDSESEEEAGIVYRWPDDWVMRDITPEECHYEGSEMQHCVGGGSYARGIEQGRIKILSLRDPNNKPHATVEVNSDGSIMQVQGKQNIHPIGKYRKRIREFMVDPRGFERLMGTKPFQPDSGRGIQDWEEFLQLPEEEQDRMLPSMIEINEKDEFNPEWDAKTSPQLGVPEGHPAGPGGYNMNYRPKHYGIYPPLQSGQNLDIGRLLSTLPAENVEENLRKLYEFSKKRKQLDRFPSEMQYSRQRLERHFAEYIPDYEDEKRGGWKDVFENLYGIAPPSTPEQEEQYKEKWNNWVSSLWNEDPAIFAQNLAKINALRFEMQGNRPKSLEEQQENAEYLYQTLSRINSLSLLHSMFSEEEYPRPEIDPNQSVETEYKSDYYPTAREYYQRAYQTGAPSPLPIEQPKNQMALFSKWKPLKKKIAMPKNPEELTEDEIITDDFVKHTRLKAFEYGFNRGFNNGWYDGVSNIYRSIGDSNRDSNYSWDRQYGIDNNFIEDRNVIENQTVFPKTLKEVDEYRINDTIDHARKDLNDVIDIVPSNFLKGGRKYTPSGKQFSKKKFIETLINDFKSMVKIGYEVGFKEAQEKTYSEEEVRTNFFHGPDDPKNLYHSYPKIDSFLSKKLEEMDAETFAYQQERSKTIDQVDWEKIHKKEILDQPDDYSWNTRKKTLYPDSQTYKDNEIRRYQYRNIADLKKLKDALKERENKAE